MINKVILLGRLGKNPETRHLEGGGIIATFTLATSERFKDKSGLPQERTEWHNIVCFGRLAEVAEKYAKKGSQIYIEGKIRYRDYTNKDGEKKYITEIMTDSLQFIGGMKQEEGNSARSRVQTYPEQTDDLPF